jgi:hypothetical protein
VTSSVCPTSRPSSCPVPSCGRAPSQCCFIFSTTCPSMCTCFTTVSFVSGRLRMSAMLAMVLHCVCSSDQREGGLPRGVSWPRWVHNNTKRAAATCLPVPANAKPRTCRPLAPSAPPSGCRCSTLAMPPGMGPACFVLHAIPISDVAWCASRIPLPTCSAEVAQAVPCTMAHVQLLTLLLATTLFTRSCHAAADHRVSWLIRASMITRTLSTTSHLTACTLRRLRSCSSWKLAARTG